MNNIDTRHITIRQLREADLAETDRVVRLAFGTFFNLPEPQTVMGDSDSVYTRWRANPLAAFVAERDSEIVGTNFAANWGSVGFFGPLAVHPDLWNSGLGQRLMEPIMDLFAQWQMTHTGLFTFANSPKHVALYQKFGFWPRFLTAIMVKTVNPSIQVAGWSRYSEIQASEQDACLRTCRNLTDAIYAGLDVESEIRSVAVQNLGDTILIRDDAGLAALAVCHSGAGTEAGSDNCYIKFGAVRPGPDSGQRFSHILDSCEAWAAARNVTRLEAGMNLAREAAYRQMRAAGFRVDFQGVAMQRANEPGYNRPDVYLIDDWR